MTEKSPFGPESGSGRNSGLASGLISGPQASSVADNAFGHFGDRSREIFRYIVDAYMETGEPVGSRTLSRRLPSSLSPATIRNAMADLQDAGLLYAPHTSAGRLPTERGLRLYVDGLMEINALTGDERRSIESECAARGKSVPQVLEQVTRTLAGLSHCAGIVLAPKIDAPFKHIEFVNLGPGRALVVMVTTSGIVENRIIEVPLGMPVSTLVEAGNYLSARLVGRTLGEARSQIMKELEDQRAELDGLVRRVVAEGLASWTGDQDESYLVVRGQSHLLENLTAVDDLERIRQIFSVLETRENVVRLLDETGRADGVNIFIGAEHELFKGSGCSMVVASFRDSQEKIAGAIGIIGPTRINYARIIPMVDYTARVIEKLIG